MNVFIRIIKPLRTRQSDTITTNNIEVLKINRKQDKSKKESIQQQTFGSDGLPPNVFDQVL